MAYVNKSYLILNAVANDTCEPFSFSSAMVTDNRDFGKNAAGAFLTRTASNIGIPVDQLTGIIEANIMPMGSVWHFVGIINKTNGLREDNTSVWRVLWGRIVESMHRTVLPFGEEDFKALKKKLLYETRNAQIVLDR